MPNFQCILDKCPRQNGENGCVCWWEMPFENEETGEVQVRKGCVLSQEISLPIVQSVVRAAHVSSEHASKARNSFEKGFEQLNELAAIAVDQQGKLLEIDKK